MRVVLDTNVFIAAGFRPGSDSARVVRAAREGELTLIWNQPTRRETEALLRRIPPLSWEPLAGLFREEHRWEGSLSEEPFRMVEDPEDRKFAALAAASGAPLITLDRHLLEVRGDPGFLALTPSRFVERLLDAAEAITDPEHPHA